MHSKRLVNNSVHVVRKLMKDLGTTMHVWLRSLYICTCTTYKSKSTYVKLKCYTRCDSWRALFFTDVEIDCILPLLLGCLPE